MIAVNRISYRLRRWATTASHRMAIDERFTVRVEEREETGGDRMINTAFFELSYFVLWFLVIIEGLALFLVFRQFGEMYMNTREGIEKGGLPLGTKAPEFSLPTPSGEQVVLSDVLRKVRGALIVMGAPHCRPCHQLLPDLHRFAESHSVDLATLFISQGSEEENRYFAGTFGRPAVLLFDGVDGRMANL
jgi:thiol-disulfide isomerase/thioredoxin